MSDPSSFVERHGVGIAVAFGILLAIIAAVAIMVTGSLNAKPIGAGAL